MMKNVLLTLILIVLVGMATMLQGLSRESQSAGALIPPNTTWTVSTSGPFEIGPGNSRTVLGTSTRRTWLRVDHLSNCGTAYLSLNGTASATIDTTGPALMGTSSITFSQGDVFRGPLEAVNDCNASSTLIITEGKY